MTLQHTRRIVKSLFILFIIVVCIYLLPRVAINAFYYPDNKVYGPTPAEAESITFTA
ncbi:alpha/beta hydrolase, partial [Salmonella enterica subsp. enterica serovar Enteritidis]|nr:alpha/beta hydrolase [Salmonella enterica subsp. enterica serovar Enteritidis]